LLAQDPEHQGMELSVQGANVGHGVLRQQDVVIRTSHNLV